MAEIYKEAELPPNAANFNLDSLENAGQGERLLEDFLTSQIKYNLEYLKEIDI